MMKQKTKGDLFTSRPEPPTLIQIAEDIFKADEDDPVFDTFKKSRSGSDLNSLETVSSTATFNQASNFIVKMKQMENTDFLRKMSGELHELRTQLDGIDEIKDYQ